MHEHIYNIHTYTHTCMYTHYYKLLIKLILIGVK